MREILHLPHYLSMVNADRGWQSLVATKIEYAVLCPVGGRAGAFVLRGLDRVSCFPAPHIGVKPLKILGIDDDQIEIGVVVRVEVLVVARGVAVFVWNVPAKIVEVRG